MYQTSMNFGDDVITDTVTSLFSHGQVCNETARLELEQLYAGIIEETDRFSRKTVSFQANKKALLHNWFKYREGFSAELVSLLLADFDVHPGNTVLDPFAGSCTTLLESKLSGLNSIGVELLPHCHLAWEAKSRAFSYDLGEVKRLRSIIYEQCPPPSSTVFPHLTITESAFGLETEKDIVAYADWFQTMDSSEDAKILLHALLMSVLEEVSFTRKDGQYLRWDMRAQKIQDRNAIRIKQQKKPFRGIHKGPIPTVKEALLRQIDTMIRDLSLLQSDPPSIETTQTLIMGNSLFELPKLPSESIDAVVTSPPYANRYDYTRTYALELAFLSVQNSIFDLRQALLSCTVENRSKLRELHGYYASLGAERTYDEISNALNSCTALKEVTAALQTRSKRGEINNTGVLRMIQQYFEELTFVFAELFRVCKDGAYVAFVNDNVQYAGEVIPVDLISTKLAESVGFIPIKVYVIPQRKGNSSQQMKKFGRRELRKSITIWRKVI